MSNANKEDLENLFRELKNVKKATADAIHELGSVYGDLVLSTWSVPKGGFNEEVVASKGAKKTIAELQILRAGLRATVDQFKKDINRVVSGEKENQNETYRSQ